MKYKIVWILPFLLTGIIIYGCTPRSKYEHRLKHELTSGVRNDSIFLGIYLGMTDKDFYIHCWKLNREGLIRQSPDNTAVEYVLKDKLKAPVTMHFYPEFDQGIIVEMPVQFAYNGWTPWNKELSSGSLQKDVLEWFKKDYGKGFITVKHPEYGEAYVKLDGNRRITIFKQDDIHVWAVFKDMLATNEADDSISEHGVSEEIIKKLE